MATIHKGTSFKCAKCGEERTWHIGHVCVDYHGICHAWVCDRCGETVPEFALRNYINTGRILIPV